MVNCYGLLKRGECGSSLAKLHSSNSSPCPYILSVLEYVTSAVSWGGKGIAGKRESSKLRDIERTSKICLS